MSKSAGTVAVLPVENHIVIVFWARAKGHRIQAKLVTGLPCDHMIGAGGVPTQTNPAYDLSIRRIESEPAPEYYDAANGLADHGIVGGAERGRVADHGGRIGRLAGRKAVEALSRLRCRKDVCSGKSIVAPAKTVCGIRLGRGDYSTPRPLIGARCSGKNNGTHDAVAVHHRGPLLI